MTPQDFQEYQQKIWDLADRFVNAELAKGTPFSEGLTNWAISKAEQMVYKPENIDNA